MIAVRRPQRGFTLLELMTVLAIIAVITITLASMSSTPSAGTPATVSNQLTGMLSLAKLRAESRRATHRVQFTATQVTVFENTTNGFTIFSATPNTVQTMQIPSGVQLWAALATTNTTASGLTPAQGTGFPFNIDFRPDGSASTGATIYLQDPTAAAKHRIYIYRISGAPIAREGW